MKLYKLVGEWKNDSGQFIKKASVIVHMGEASDTLVTQDYHTFNPAAISIVSYPKAWWQWGASPTDVETIFGKPPLPQALNETLSQYPLRFYLTSTKYIRCSASGSNCNIEYYNGSSLVGKYQFGSPTYNNGSDYAGISIPNPNNLDVSNRCVCRYPKISVRGTSTRITYQYNTWAVATMVTGMTPAQWNEFFEGLTPYDEGNPYFDGGISDMGGGGGNFSEDSDDVDVDLLPNYDAIGTGFATLFTPSKSQLTHLADVMWNNNIFSALQNLVENITGMFTSLAIVPFQVTAGSTVEVTWLGLPMTGINLTLASEQFYEFDMGSIDMASDSRIFTSGSALDYSPYSKLGIFLPFIGYQDLDIDECRDAIIGLKYRIDILSGTCVALISVDGNTIYQFTGNCLSQIPITNENMQSLVSDAVNVGIAAAATHSAMGAASADMTAAEGSSKISEAAKDAKIAHAQAHVANSAGQLSSATANAAMGMKPTYGKAGAISASASLLAVKQPYLFLSTPRQSLPNHYQRYCGFPSNISGKLSEFSGFTVVEDIRLNGLVATSPEVAEIYELLKKGVII